MHLSRLVCALVFTSLVSVAPVVAHAQTRYALVASGDRRLYEVDLEGKRVTRRSEPLDGVGRLVLLAWSSGSRVLVASRRDRFQASYDGLVEVDLASFAVVRAGRAWRDERGEPFTFGEVYDLKTFPAARRLLVACQLCGDGAMLFDLDSGSLLGRLPEVVITEAMWISQDGQRLLSLWPSAEKDEVAYGVAEVVDLKSHAKRRSMTPDWAQLAPEFGSEPQQKWLRAPRVLRAAAGGVSWQAATAGKLREWHPAAGGGALSERVLVDEVGSRLLVPVARGKGAGQLVVLSFTGKVVAEIEVGPWPTNALLASRWRSPGQERRRPGRRP